MNNTPERPDRFSIEVGRQAIRRARTLRNPDSIWFGLSTAGLIGWTIAIPAVLGALGGLWLDKHHPGPHSWALALLAAGLVFGCWNAWNWVAKQGAAITANGDDENG
jgi:ATP synthase protein I